MEIDEKSMQNRVWVVLGAEGRFGDAPGRARDGSGTPKNRPEADLGAPGAGQDSSGTVQKSPRDDPETLPDDPGALLERVWCVKRCRTCSRIDFSQFLRRLAEARSLKFMRPRSVSWTSNKMSKAGARVPKNLENRCVSGWKIDFGSGRATQNRARKAQIERPSASEAPPGPPKI